MSNKMFAKVVALDVGSDAGTTALKWLTDDALVIHELRPATLTAYFKLVPQSLVDGSRRAKLAAGGIAVLPPFPPELPGFIP
jgi:uncharacterized protein YegL